MITDLCDDLPIPPPLEVLAAASASASSSPGRPIPPMTSPPILRNDRRERPSQKFVCAPGPHSVSMGKPLSLSESSRETPSARVMQYRQHGRQLNTNITSVGEMRQ